MELKVKDVDISTGGPLAAILNERDALKLDIEAIERVKIIKGKRSIVVTVNIATSGINEGEIGIYEEVLSRLKAKNNDKVNVEIEEKPTSLNFIKKKLDGKILNSKEINTIVEDIVKNKINAVEQTYFVSACYSKGLNLNESAYLTNAIVNNSKQLKFKNKIIVDKHSIGGLSGNRTTPIIVPIVASAGLTIPKTSSRAITSPAGTADVMEVFCPVELPIKKIKEVVKKTNACLVWGGTKDLACADDSIIKLERHLSLDPEGILLASIMSKKKAVNATHVLIDIPVGTTAKVKDKKRALNLKNKFIDLGKKLKIKVKVIITDGSQPIGNGIGPALEAIDIISILKGNGPTDLKNKALYMSSLILEMAGIKDTKKKVAEILYSGRAYKKFKEIIKAQGGNIANIEKIKVGKFSYKYKSNKPGKVRAINNKLLTHLTRILGCPGNKESGIYLNYHIKDKVKKNSTLFIMYSNNKKKLQHGINFIKSNRILQI